MTKKFRKAGCVFLAWVMAASLASGTMLAFADGGKKNAASAEIIDTVSFKDVTGKVNLNKVALENMSESVIENAGLAPAAKDEKRTVIVTLDGDCIMDGVTGGQSAADYLATYAGAKKLKNIEKEQQSFLTSLSSLGVSYKVKYRYSTVANAVAIEVNTANLSKIKSISSVKYAVVSETYAQPKEEEGASPTSGTTNPSNVYATGIYDSSKYVEEGLDGSGMTVAVLDTGIDYTHEAFSTMPVGELGLTKSDLSEKLKNGKFNAVRLSAENGADITADDLYVNDKIPFAYDYADGDADVYPSANQHGPHVAGIVAGHASSYKNKDGEQVNEEFNGVAPNAQLVICKVFTDKFESKDYGGATTEWLIAALEDCVLLGVDVINMSLGSTAGFSSLYIDGDDEGIALATVYDSIKNAGINLICAASNEYSSGFGSAFGTNLASNPDSGVVGSPSTYAGALSVASINGQLSPFVLANGKDVIYYLDASDENAVRMNFLKDMLGGRTSAVFKYVVVPGVGQAGNYTSTIKNQLNNKAEGEKVIAVVQRGSNTFKDKVEIAKRMGADAIIIYNNVAGTVGISIGDLDEADRIPAVSVTMDAGNLLKAKGSTGTIEINAAYQAGPFMNDYSSWGTTPDLKIKPEITAHGGEITSAVSGGYAEMSGTSMASPNMAGFVALLRGKLKAEHPEKTNVEITRLINQIVMSTAITVLDQEGLPYSPRKQGAGLATLDNVFSTNAFLYTKEGVDIYGAEDNRPKIELGDDKKRTGVYDDMIFYVENFGSEALSFVPKTIFMTETLSSDGLSVAEKARLLGDIPAEWWVNDNKIGAGATVEVAAGSTVKIKVKLTLSDAEKKYIDTSFKNGMFVEGFLQLISADASNQCSLSLPFMGFYGDWSDAPMLDYSSFDITNFKKDTSYDDETRPQEQVWATQAYLTYYYNELYSVPMGGFMYLQDENADQIYVEEEHCSVSRYTIYNGEDDPSNYMTSTGIKALYAGLLRNAELVTYDLYDEATGEMLLENQLYRIAKAYAGGGSAVPSNVEIRLYPEELGLVNNGKYRLSFNFYFNREDANDPEKQRDENSFTMSFYVDYDAPVLEDVRIRYYDYKENNRDKQRVYLDLDVYDNHYAQAVILCYADTEGDITDLKLATEYVSPVYNANKNGTTTVSIEITDFYKTYQNRLYCQIDDYALNHSVYQILFAASNTATLPDEFEIEDAKPVRIGNTTYDHEVTIGVNETYKVALSYEGSANLSNFTWNSSPVYVARVQNGEIFGASAGTSVVTVTGASGAQKKIYVHVVASNTTLSWPSISFGIIKDNLESLVKAQGTVKVNAGQDFKLEVMTDPWYYIYSPTSKLSLRWSSSDESVATVDRNGNVSTAEKKGTAVIRATLMNGESATSYSANVSLSVQEPFTVSNGVLTAYHGRGGDNGYVKIPDDENITAIDTDAFKDNDNIKVIIIPKTVTRINEKAFKNCKALEEVYFIKEEKQPIPDSSLSVIYKQAFVGCTSLKKIDLSNVKTITLDNYAFEGCTSLEEVVNMKNIGSMYDGAFRGCSSLKEADITGLHVTGTGVFAGCTALETVKTDYYTSLGRAIFYGCTSLKNITINCPTVYENAFENCSNLQTVTFGGAGASSLLTEFGILSEAFYNCRELEAVTFGNGYSVAYIGDRAFANCAKLSSVNLPEGAEYGVKVFENTLIASKDDVYGGAIYIGTTLMLAPETITSDFVIRPGTTEIYAYAFSGSRFADGVTLTIPDSVTEIGEGAFSRSTLKSAVLPAGLTEIPAYAFSRTLLESITVPAGVEVIGTNAFAYSANLASVTFAGSRSADLTLGYGAFSGCNSLASITLPTLNGGIAERAFYNCSALASANIANATEIENYAFYNCSSLAEVTGLENVTEIGSYAFGNCAINKLNLASAAVIGDGAFYNARYSELKIPKAVTIGDEAFYGGGESAVQIRASLKKLGGGAFANSKNLTAFTAEGNDNFFAEDGVLYRILASGVYELSAYPSGKTTDGKTYAVKDGTASINAGAFAGLASGALNEAVLPYSLKEIGAGAFYASGIKSYVFNSIAAPALLSKYYEHDTELWGFYSLFYNNFETELQSYVGGARTSNLTISYPTNGEGYDNYLYKNYFASATLLGELMDDTTRALKTLIEGFASAAEVAGWLNLEKNTENTEKVARFSESVKAAHTAYLTVNGEKQLEYLGGENVKKLFDIEAALKPVKEKFGIAVRVSSLSVAADSEHRTVYKVGEKFDTAGLKIIITYDDYSTEQADLSKVKIDSYYDRELELYDNEVALTYEGRTVRVLITVTEEGEQPAETPKKKSGCRSAIEGSAYGLAALGVLAGTLAAAVAVKRKRV